MPRLYHPGLLAALAACAACGQGMSTPRAAIDAASAADAAAVVTDSGSPLGAEGSAPAAPDAAPPPICDPKTYGARGDGKTLDTMALQAAIDACGGTGGTVRVHDGTYLTGTIRLRSSMTFHVEPSATILGSQNVADYPDLFPPSDNTQLSNCRKALVYAEGVHDLVVDGGGTIDGNGNIPQWIGPSTIHPERTRPMVFFGALSDRVTVRDVTLQNSAVWGLVNMQVDDLLIDHVNIHSLLSGNRDGIDVVDCHHVVIQNSTIASEDDSICLKSGTRRGVDDVTVKNCHVIQSIVANALKMGTASYGAFTNVTFDTITIDAADKAAMAVESVDGADIANITFRNIQFQNVGSPIFILLGYRGTTPADDVPKMGSIDGVTFDTVTGSNMRYHWSSPISGTTLPDGTTHRLQNLVLSNVHITNKGGMTSVPADPPEYAGQYPDPNLWGDMPAYGLFLRHAQGVTLANSTPLVTPGDARQGIVTRDVSGLSVR